MGQTSSLIIFMAILHIFTLKLLEIETVFWDTTVQREEIFLGQTRLNYTVSSACTM